MPQVRKKVRKKLQKRKGKGRVWKYRWVKVRHQGKKKTSARSSS